MAIDSRLATATATATRSQPRPFLVGSLIVAVASSIFLLWMLLRIDGPRVTDAVDDLGELVAAVCAATVGILAARRSESRRTGWALLAASCIAWGVGEAFWSYYDLIRGVQVPFPSLADAGFVCAIPLMAAGLLLFPCYPRSTAKRLQGVLDGLIISVSLLFASWATILGPIYRSHNGSVLKQVLSLTYPASDVVMVSLVVILISRARGPRRTTLELVMAGIAAFAIADSAFAYLTEVNNYGIGSFLDTGWVAGFLLIALGALRDVTNPAPEVAGSEASTLSLVAPYVPVLAVLVVTAYEILRGRHIGVITWILAFSLALLVLGREGLNVWDKRTDRRPVDSMPAPAPTSWQGET